MKYLQTVLKMNVFCDIFYEDQIDHDSGNPINKELEKGIPSTSSFEESQYSLAEGEWQDDLEPQFKDKSQDLWDYNEPESLIDDVNQITDFKSKSKAINCPSQPINPKQKQKNSNVVKKSGRMILDHLEEFKVAGSFNEGVEAMLKLLDRRKKERKTLKDRKDSFNTMHLKALFNSCSDHASSHNLRVTRKLFNRCMRKEVLDSFQIKQSNKVLYLNTLKCSSLRFCNRKLASRLQMSQNVGQT